MAALQKVLAARDRNRIGNEKGQIFLVAELCAFEKGPSRCRLLAAPEFGSDTLVAATRSLWASRHPKSSLWWITDRIPASEAVCPSCSLTLADCPKCGLYPGTGQQRERKTLYHNIPVPDGFEQPNLHENAIIDCESSRGATREPRPGPKRRETVTQAATYTRFRPPCGQAVTKAAQGSRFATTLQALLAMWA